MKRKTDGVLDYSDQTEVFAFGIRHRDVNSGSKRDYWINMLLRGKRIEFVEFGLWDIVYNFLCDTCVARQVNALAHDSDVHIEAVIEKGEVKKAYIIIDMIKET